MGIGWLRKKGTNGKGHWSCYSRCAGCEPPGISWGWESPSLSPNQKATEKVQKERPNIILKFNKTCLRDKQVGAFCCLDLYGHFLGDSYARCVVDESPMMIRFGSPSLEFFFIDSHNELMVNCWFGLVVWIPGIPENERDCLFGGILRIPNHRAPIQHLTISWHNHG